MAVSPTPSVDLDKAMAASRERMAVEHEGALVDTAYDLMDNYPDLFDYVEAEAFTEKYGAAATLNVITAELGRG